MSDYRRSIPDRAYGELFRGVRNPPRPLIIRAHIGAPRRAIEDRIETR
jgi:hypothetical protein